MRKMKHLLFLTIVVSLLASCSKDEVGYKTVSYQQTYCADPWRYDNGDDITQARYVGNYLDSLGLFHTSVLVKVERPGDLCLACTCKSGKVIYVVTKDEESVLQQYRAIGFN
jgi:hypothetical protein